MIKGLILLIIFLLCSCGGNGQRGEVAPVSKQKYAASDVFVAMTSHYGRTSIASGLLGVRWQLIPKDKAKKPTSFIFHVDFWIGKDRSMRLKFQQTLGQFLDISVSPAGEVVLFAPTEGVYFKSKTKALFGAENATPELICLEALAGPFPIVDQTKPIKIKETTDKLVIHYFDSVVGMPAECVMKRDLPIVLIKKWSKDGVLFAEATYDGEREFDDGIKRPKKVIWRLPGLEFDDVYTVGVKIFEQPKELMPLTFQIKLPVSAREITEKEFNQLIFERVKCEDK